jgi:predicted transcriptional regulator
MVLASIEIGTRCYEFKAQYIDKTKDKKKNIILPDINDFNDRYIKSLEEFNITGEIKDLVKIYNFLKNAKSRYRVSLDDLPYLEFSRCFSNNSKVKKILITLHKNL